MKVMTTTTLISRTEFISAVEANIQRRELEYEKAKKGSFAERGAYCRLSTAKNLLWRLKNNKTVSNREAAAYFGKGVKFDS